MDNNLEFVLAHDGIKGQKKGVRRYRNYDGTLTPEGKERYNYSKKDDDKDSKDNKQKTEQKPKTSKPKGKTSDDYKVNNKNNKNNNNNNKENKENKDKKDKKDEEYTLSKEYRSKSSLMKEAKNMTYNIADTIPNTRGKTVKKDYSDLTNRELSDRINRLKLEDEYGRLSGDTQYIKSGSEKVKDLLKVVGGFLGVAASAYTIASIREDIKYKKQQNKKNK